MEQNMTEMILRESEINRIVGKSSDHILQRIVDRCNNFDDDIVKAAIAELKTRNVTI